MSTFREIFDRIIIVLGGSALALLSIAAFDELSIPIAKVTLPAYASKQMLTTEEAIKLFYSRCDDQWWLFELNPCRVTPEKITETQIGDLDNHRYRYDSETVGSREKLIENTAGGLATSLLLIALLRLLHNFYSHFVRPALRRASAQTRALQVEKEFFQVKLLHDNGVLSDEEFALKKEQLRARVMTE